MEEQGRFWGIWFLLLIVLYGWLSFSGDYRDFYNQKVTLSSYLVVGDKASIEDLNSLKDTNLERAHVVAVMETMGPSVNKEDASLKRKIITAFGETDLRYHLKLKSGDFVPTTFDFSSNALYNFSYIVNTPSKLIHNIKADFSIDKLFIGTNNKIEKIHGKMILWMFIIWDSLNAITGIGFAIIMLFIGSILGLVFHPLQSIANFFPSLWQLVVTTWHAVSYLINLFR